MTEVVLMAWQVPIHLQEEVQCIVNEVLVDGILEKVMEPMAWILPGIFITKEGGKAGLTLVTAFSHLNQYVKRQFHPVPSS